MIFPRTCRSSFGTTSITVLYYKYIIRIEHYYDTTSKHDEGLALALTQIDELWAADKGTKVIL
jgi:hypothetical protein